MPLSAWIPEDVQSLVDERIPEGQRLDYKEQLPLERDADRAELAKDVSGMANAVGGLLIYGVAEDDSDEPRPQAVRPLPRAGQQTRVEDVLDSTVLPRLDYECRTLDFGDGSVLIVQAAPRAGGPHMVQGYKQHRYFIRRGTRTIPMTEDDVRVAYEAARTRADRLDEMLTHLPLLPRIGRSRTLDEVRMGAHRPGVASARECRHSAARRAPRPHLPGTGP
jgi:predicted HTH transcriptional regulator